jgi:threonylcarbamoyladenosine tRNA methylthiotransferase MtaB
MPNCCIGVDVLVGLPGETEEEFKETYDFLNGLDISYLHVFTYSERANTPAAEMKDQVPMAVRKQRNKMLRILSAKKLRDFYQKNIGTTHSVLFEHEQKENFMYGFTENYVKVKLPYDPSLINQINQLSIKGFDDDGVMNGELVSEKISI